MVQSVTVGIIAYNEQTYLPEVLDDLLSQSYSKEQIEIILVDGNSSDNTLSIMQEFQQENSDKYRSIKIYENSKRVQPAGWNIVIILEKMCVVDLERT